MNKKLKGLGLALLAVLALSGIAAAGAQAETAVESELKAPAVTAIDINNDVNEHGKLARLTIGNGARYVECTNFDFGGAITGLATTIKGTAEITECFAQGLTDMPVTITHNKCELSITALKNSTASATASCPTGPTEIQIHTYENEEQHKLNGKVLCTYDITLAKPQTVTGAVITTSGSGKTHGLTVDLSKATKLKEIFNTGPGGLAVCGVASGKHTEASFSGLLNITGTNGAKLGEHVGITLV